MSTDEFKGWAAKSAGAKLELISFTPPPQGPFDVTLEVTSCGICHSDLHLNDGDWGPFSVYPQVSGHEIVGTVISKGEMAAHEVGAVVAVGWQRGSCHSCGWCGIGSENLCKANTPNCAAGGKGGFADKWRGDSRFCFAVPKGLDTKFVGPLMCGGITMYNPLVRHTVPGERVGILGIGGLGHLGIKFASARGNTVTAFSRSETKRKETEALAENVTYVSTSDPAQLAAAEGTIDCLIVTITASVDWEPYIKCMRPNGKIVFVGAITDKPLAIPVFGDLVFKQLAIVGSVIGGSKDMKDMLDFARDHPNCLPIIEVMKFHEVNEACKRVAASDVRFRMVLEY